MKKRLLAIVLSLLMILTVIPTSVFAAETEPTHNSDGSAQERTEWLDYLAANGISTYEEGEAAPSATNDFVDAAPSSADFFITSQGSSSTALQPLASPGGTGSTTNRYTVLVLDRSGSMYGTPLSAMKTAATNFCDAVLKAEGNNYVAVVAYDTSAGILSDFVSDFATLQTAISGIRDLNMTNTNDGLVKAGNLLSAISDGPGVIKNILLLSDGMPNEGAYSSSGPYTYADYYYRQYANATYDTATNLKAQGYNIYTLGFFHSLTGNELAFARQFMADLQNKGYYDVVDPNDLEFVFGEIADDITKDNYPIVIVPGIMGSKLFKGPATDTNFTEKAQIWQPIPAFSLSLLKLGETLQYDTTLRVVPCQDQQLLTPWDPADAQQVALKEATPSTPLTYREYGVQDTYKELVDTLCSEFPGREVYFFSYDWRWDNAESAATLKTFLDSLSAEKVDLVCHSQGGLIASKYYVDNKTSHKINKVITAGTPYEGAPKLINSVQNWDVIEAGTIWNLNDLFLGFAGLDKEVKASSDSVAQLIPTQNYISKIPMWKDSWLPFNLGDYQLTYDQYLAHCRRIFTDDRINNTVLPFQNSLKDSSGYNALLSYPDAYFAIGVGQPTISAIKFQYTTDGIDQLMYESDLDYTMKGDATAPYLSTSIMEQVEKLDKSRYRTYETNHAGIAGHHDPAPSKQSEQAAWLERCAGADQTVAWMVRVLSGDTPADDSTPLPTSNHIVVRIACPVDATISLDGESLSSNPTEPNALSSFGRMDILGAEDEIKMFCLNDADDYEIALQGTDTGTMDYAIRLFNADGTLLDERVANDVPVTKNTHITTSSDFTKPIVLSIDSDGDGAADSELSVSPMATDTSALSSAITAAKALNAGDYTTDSWAKLQKALEDAEAVLSNPGATQAEVDAAIAALNSATSGLQRTDSSGSSTGAGGKTPSTGDGTASTLVLVGLACLTLGCLSFIVRHIRKRRHQ
jgi:pimeloyl-ACP methyl ester carboxylesterase